MSDNTLQYQWIVTIQGGLDSLLADFVGGNLLWYPDPTTNKVRMAPDVLVALGRPKGHRGSYKQWEEDNVAPQIVFEILSPSNTRPQMDEKRTLYQRHGVREYYELDPQNNRLRGWRRGGELLIEIANMDGWTSPLLGIRFWLGETEPRIEHPGGDPFFTFEQQHRRAALEHQRAEQARQELERAQKQAEQERLRAEQERLRAEQERRRAEAALERERRLLELLRAAGIDPNA